MEEKSPFTRAIRRLEELTVVQATRSGLVKMIPILTIGAFALILKTFPVEAYQTFIADLAGGFVLGLLDLVYSATFGVLSLYMTIFISRSYMELKADQDVVGEGATAASLLCFFILAGAYLPSFGTDSMGPKSMFLAILTGLGPPPSTGSCSWPCSGQGAGRSSPPGPPGNSGGCSAPSSPWPSPP